MSNTSDDNPWDKIALPALADKNPWPEVDPNISGVRDVPKEAWNPHNVWPEAPKVQKYELDFDPPPVKISYPLPDAPIWPIARTFIKEGSNLVDNEGNLYFECESCGKLFDPQTNSFKKLHDDARLMGWKVKWNLSGLGYRIYCAECGEPTLI